MKTIYTTIDGTEVKSLPGTGLGIAAYAILNSLILQPIRALGIAYGYVLRGEKVDNPMNWRDI